MKYVHHLVLTTLLFSSHYRPHFTDEEIETWKQVTCFFRVAVLVDDRTRIHTHVCTSKNLWTFHRPLVSPTRY